MDTHSERLSVISNFHSSFSPVFTGIFACSLITVMPYALSMLTMWPVSFIAIAA